MFQQAIENYLTTHHFDKLNLKAVLFDMDGVLFDSMKNHAAAWHAAKIRYFSMSYIILLNNIRLFNFFVSVYYD